MARKSNGRKSAERDGSGRFAKGNPGGPGRPPGSPNRRTLAGRALLKALEAGDEGESLPSGFERMRKLLLDEDPRIRLGAERLVLGLLHGRPVADGETEDGRGPAGIDPAGLALRAANLLAGLVSRHPEPPEDDGPESPAT